MIVKATDSAFLPIVLIPIPVYLSGMTGWSGETPRVAVMRPVLLSAVARGPRPGPSPRREEILGLVRASPGICAQELCARTGLTRTALSHHLHNLVRAGQITQVRQGRRVTHFVPGVAKPTLRQFLGLLRLTTVRRMLQELAADPTISRRSLARRTGHTPHTIRWHMRRLQQTGILAVTASASGEGVVRFHPDVMDHVRGISSLHDDVGHAALPTQP